MDESNVKPQLKQKEDGEARIEGPNADDATHKNGEAERERNVIYRLLKIHTRFRFIMLVAFFVVSFATIAGSVYFCWFYLIPIVWNWGFFPETTWKAVLSVLGCFYLGIAPFFPAKYSWDTVWTIISGYVDEQEEALKSKLKDLRKHQKTAEEKLVSEDKTGLIPLIQYSRIQLEAYYTIGLSQTQRSFRYSVLAMWIGFVVIVGGIALYFFPFPLGDSARGTLADIRAITIAGGVVIEIISALFLWIYRSSVNQLNYFYSRQMHIHNVLLCDRIASSMSKPDDTKHLIVEKVLSSSWDIKPLPGPGRGISKLIKNIGE